MKLHAFLAERQITQTAFAKAIGVTSVAAGRYVSGVRFPRPTVIAKIEALTEGAVTASDLVQGHLDALAAAKAKARAKAAAATRKARCEQSAAA